MKANELRVGNWIIGCNGKYFQIFEDGMEILMGARNYGDFDPIPLTPEILEKAGFEKGLNGYFFRGGVEYNLKRHMLEGFGYCEILYVHQLQNLYYALTGEELNIEL
jgi:hypothetical protein